MSKKKKVTLEGIAGLIRESHEDLACSVAKGFEEVHGELKDIKGQMSGLKQQVQGTNNRIDALVDQKVSWDTHTRLADRVSRLEVAAGVRR